jgi:hypothetical protein
VRLKFEGLDRQGELERQLTEWANAVTGFPEQVFGSMRALGLTSQLSKLVNGGEDMGKRMNVEVKKFIKANKEKQMPYSIVDLDIIKPVFNPLQCKVYPILTIHIEKCP